MNIKSNIKLEYKDAKHSEIIYRSLEVDNEGFVKGSLNENTINFEIESNSLGSFLSTADDLISSEILAEALIKKTKNDQAFKNFRK